MPYTNVPITRLEPAVDRLRVGRVPLSSNAMNNFKKKPKLIVPELTFSWNTISGFDQYVKTLT